MTMKDKVFADYTANLTAELSEMCQRLNDEGYYEAALKLLMDCYRRGGRIHVTGVGKPMHIAGYIASLFSSIGFHAYTLDGTEATHGSAGQVDPKDVVIAISYYGNPVEMIKTTQLLHELGIQMIAVTGFDDSEVARMADVHLNVHIGKEGDSIGKPPRVSMLSTVICLQNLSVLFQSARELTTEEYLRWHPSGEIGKSQ